MENENKSTYTTRMMNFIRGGTPEFVQLKRDIIQIIHDDIEETLKPNRKSKTAKTEGSREYNDITNTENVRDMLIADVKWSKNTTTLRNVVIGKLSYLKNKILSADTSNLLQLDSVDGGGNRTQRRRKRKGRRSHASWSSSIMKKIRRRRMRTRKRV